MRTTITVVRNAESETPDEVCVFTNLTEAEAGELLSKEAIDGIKSGFSDFNVGSLFFTINYESDFSEEKLTKMTDEEVYTALDKCTSGEDFHGIMELLPEERALLMYDWEVERKPTGMGWNTEP